MTYSIKQHIQSLSKSIINSKSGSKKEIEEKYEEWKTSNNKKYLKGYFKNPIFGAFYVRDLFDIRVDTFYETLSKVTAKDEKVKSYFETKNRITSIGCGPGSEICAFLKFVVPLRRKIQNKNMLEITAIDKLSYWEEYINTISMESWTSSIIFENENVQETFVKDMDESDICIVSFIDASHSNNMWNELKKKFSLIIILEVKEFNLESFDYKQCNFKGNKRIWYYISPEEISDSDVSSKNLVNAQEKNIENQEKESLKLNSNNIHTIEAAVKNNLEVDENSINTITNPEHLKPTSSDICFIQEIVLSTENDEIKEEFDEKSINPALESECLQSNPINIDLINGNPEINEENIKNNELVEGNLCNENCSTAMDNSTNTESAGYSENNNINTNALKRKITDDNNDDEVSDKRACI